MADGAFELPCPRQALSDPSPISGFSDSVRRECHSASGVLASPHLESATYW
jgi:hypothetical protein